MIPIDKLHPQMTTPKSNYSKYCRQFRKAVALAVQDLERCRYCRFWAWSFSGLSPQIRVLAHKCHVDRHSHRHGHFTLNQLRLSVLNETYRNSFTGPRLFTGISLIRVQYLKVKVSSYNSLLCILCILYYATMYLYTIQLVFVSYVKTMTSEALRDQI